MIVAALAWLTGMLVLGFLLVWHLRRAHVAAVAVMLILIPQVYVRPALFLLGMHHPYPAEFFYGPSWDLVAKGLIIALCWMLIVSAVHLLFHRALSPVQVLLPQVRGPINPKFLVAAAIFTTALGALLTGIFVVDAGSVGNFMYLVKVDKAMAGSYVVREISVIGAVFAIFVILHYERKFREAPPGTGSRKMVWAGTLLFLVSIAFNYFWGNRYNIAMLLFAFGVSWHFAIRRLTVTKMLVLVLVAAAGLQMLKVLRTETVGEALGRDVSGSQPFWEDVSSSLHLNQFDAFMLALRDAGTKFQFRDGKDFRNGLLAWVPRRFYPEKETFQVGWWFRRVYQPDRVNGWPITTMGDWYVNFGYWGIVFGGIISGLIAAAFDAGYRRVKDSMWQAAIAPALAFLMFDGGVDAGFIQEIVLRLPPVFLLALLLNMTRRRDAEAAVRRSRYRAQLAG